MPRHDSTQAGARMVWSDDLVGSAQIAEAAHVKGKIIVQWVRRHRDFAVPVAATSAGRIWLWSEVRAWLIATGRPYVERAAVITWPTSAMIDTT